MLKLKLQYFGHLMQRADSLEKTLMGKIEGWERLKVHGEGDDRGWDGWMASLNQWTWVWVNSRSWWRTGRPGVLHSMGLQRVGHNCATELNWTSQYHLLLLSPTISVLYCTHRCMKCSLGISNFLEEISSLSHSIVLLHFFALITEEGFVISLCSSLELCIQMDLSFLFSFAFFLSSTHSSL